MVIDVQKLIDNNISPTGYVICRLLEKYLATDELYECVGDIIWTNEFDNLEEQSYIQESSEDYKITNKFIEVFNITKKEAFDELWESFPSGHGSRKFKQFKKEDIAKKYYNEIKGDRMLHEHILKCLEYEKNNTNLQYMRNIKTWIHNRTWEAFSDKVEGKEEGKQGVKTEFV